MRKHLIVAGALLAAVGLARAANYNDGGCGLGSLIFQKNTQGEQILAATTNGIGSQTSAISSQTSDCREDHMVRKEKEREVFVALNLRSLSRELAAGEGEFASSFASLMGCGQAVPQFLSFAKENYDALFPAAGVTPTGLVRTVEARLAAHPALSASCTL